MLSRESKSIRIVYDYQIFTVQEYGGVSRYFYELATRLYNDGINTKIMAPLYINRYLPRANPNVVFGKHIFRIPKAWRFWSIVNMLISKKWLRENPPDILHETYYSRHPIRPRGAKIVVTVYDMIHEKLGQFFPGDNVTVKLKENAVRRADHVICISGNTKKDLLEIYNIDPDKVSVVYLGYSLQNGCSNDDTPIVSDPYLLYVGFRGAYKNFVRLVQAYARSKKLRQDFKLVWFGGGKFKNNERELFHELGLNNNCIIQVSGDDATLANLYKHAILFVGPSLYEGFGLAPLEAMAHHCPVVCSNTGSLPEVAGEAAQFFDPTDVDSIMNAIETVVYSQERSAELITLGLERIKYFSWDRCAADTYAIYTSLSK